jgi:benzaldehyde dehydrogenase (NAD)
VGRRFGRFGRFGRFRGRAGLHEFIELPWVTVQTTPRQSPF